MFVCISIWLVRILHITYSLRENNVIITAIRIEGGSWCYSLVSLFVLESYCIRTVALCECRLVYLYQPTPPLYRQSVNEQLSRRAIVAV
jgi:hypothetical protein